MSESDRLSHPSVAASSEPATPALPTRRGWLGWLVLLSLLSVVGVAVRITVERSKPAPAAKAAGKGESRAEPKGPGGVEAKGPGGSEPAARGEVKGEPQAAVRGEGKGEGKSEPGKTEVKGDSAGARKGGGPPPVVGVRQVRVGPIDVVQTGLGSVVPRNTVVVRSRVDGPLKQVLFREGEMVRAGQLLALIDPAIYEVALQQATGALARDEAVLRNARLDLERFKTLLAQDSIARQQVDTQESLVRQSEGTLLSNRAQVDNAKLQLSYTRITAPIAGRAGLRLIDAGNLIRANDATGLVTIAQISPITVVFPIPEDALQPVLAQLAKGAKLRVEAWDRANLNRLATGMLLTVDNQIDASTGTVKLKAQFANTDGALFPNQFVNVRLKLDRLEEAILVPPVAIQRGREGTFVYALDEENRVRVVPVKPGASTPEQVAVEADLAAGTRLVIDGADRLRPGMRVEVAERSGEGKGGPRKKRESGPAAGPAAGQTASPGARPDAAPAKQ